MRRAGPAAQVSVDSGAPDKVPVLELDEEGTFENDWGLSRV
jgi:hypothetical protein